MWVLRTVESRIAGSGRQGLSDSDLKAASALGVAYRVSDEMVQTLESYNLDIEDASGKTHHLLRVAPGE
jgi:hypothetical protein